MLEIDLLALAFARCSRRVVRIRRMLKPERSRQRAARRPRIRLLDGKTEPRGGSEDESNRGPGMDVNVLA